MRNSSSPIETSEVDLYDRRSKLLTFDTYGYRYVGWYGSHGQLEKLWNIENSGESYNRNYVEFPDADFVAELERKI